MSWQVAAFRKAYLADGGSPNSASSYATYLRRVDPLIHGIDEQVGTVGSEAALACAENLPAIAFGSAKNRSDSLSALRWYLTRAVGANAAVEAPNPPPMASDQEIRGLLREAKLLGARYYRLTGKPLGVTGEVAELEAAEKLGLTLLDARTAGCDAIQRRSNKTWRVQIKGRAVM